MWYARMKRRPQRRRAKSRVNPLGVFITYFLFSIRARPSLSTERNRLTTSGSLSYTTPTVYLYIRRVGLKTNRPTIVFDLHRTLKGIKKKKKNSTQCSYCGGVMAPSELFKGLSRHNRTFI